jgi:hypothetical protein
MWQDGYGGATEVIGQALRAANRQSGMIVRSRNQRWQSSQGSLEAQILAPVVLSVLIAQTPNAGPQGRPLEQASTALLGGACKLSTADSTSSKDMTDRTILPG